MEVYKLNYRNSVWFDFHMETFDEAGLARLKSYINQSVDLANGLETATNDGSMYAFTTNPAPPKTLSVGQSFTVGVTITPNVEIPVWFRSTDTSVATVDDNGKVTALKAGTTVIGVYVAGEVYGITITVS